jgi:radical SAM protein with 4Fe4S-binding SPASM domain
MSGAPERLDPSILTRLVKEFACIGGEKVCLSGGEPLCYKELQNVIKLCQKENLNISLYTTGITRINGSLQPIDEKTAEFLAKNNVKTIFSLHGAQPSTNDKLTRIPGSFLNTLKTIKRTKNAGVQVELHVVPTALNYNELKDIAKIANSFGIKKISWLRFVPQGRGGLNKNLLQLDNIQIQKLTEIKEEIEQLYPSLIVRTGAPFNILCPEEPASCDAGISILTIRPDGYISPCDAFKRFVKSDRYDNILKNSLSEIWKDSYILNLIRALHNLESTSSCTSCSLYSTCHSGCLAQKAIAAGTLVNGKDPGCPLNNVEVVRGEVEAVTIR